MGNESLEKENEDSEEEAGGLSSGEESSENFFGQEDEESDWDREVDFKIDSPEKQNVNVAWEPPLENVNNEVERNEVLDTCMGEPSGFEKSNEEFKEGKKGIPNNLSSSTGGMKIFDIGPTFVQESQHGPKEKEMEGVNPDLEAEPISGKLSDKLKVLLSRQTPIKEKLAKIEGEEEQKIETVKEIDLEKRFNLVEKRMTRSQSKSHMIGHHRMSTRSRDSSVSEGVAQRLEEIGGKCGLKKRSGRGKNKNMYPAKGDLSKKS
ncbi:hypothetical protein L1887_06541 [Cichorium endivia]|nr:hypothetical protein L1887_06541 [Cichorium endivia]